MEVLPGLHHKEKCVYRDKFKQVCSGSLKDLFGKTDLEEVRFVLLGKWKNGKTCTSSMTAESPRRKDNIQQWKNRLGINLKEKFG